LKVNDNLLHVRFLTCSDEIYDCGVKIARFSLLGFEGGDAEGGNVCAVEKVARDKTSEGT
jgi:hypothetical protein